MMDSQIIHWRDYFEGYVDKEVVEEIMKTHTEFEGEHTYAINEWAKSPEANYTIYTKGKITNVCYTDIREEDGLHSFHMVKCNKWKNAADVEDNIYPNQCRQRIENAFREETGKTFASAFHKVYASEFFRCVPKPLYYIDRKHTKVEDVRYIDVSSMYPAMACGALPDAKTMVYCDGRVEPTEDWPFAFYINSHHCAEYGVFDTHDYFKLEPSLMRALIYNSEGKPIYNRIEDDQEMTVLMKPSKYELTGAMQEIYAEKLMGDPVAKATMVKGLGTLHRNPFEKNRDPETFRDYYHVAAIFEGRANALQISKINEIVDLGGIIYQVIVDSIIYGDAPDLGRKEKVLGTYNSEFYGQKVNYLCSGSINKYVIYTDDNKILKCVVSGVKNPVINKPEDILNYKKAEF